MRWEDGADHPINGPAAWREAVSHLQAAMGLSERRACSIVGADCKMVRLPLLPAAGGRAAGHHRVIAVCFAKFGLWIRSHYLIE